MSTRWPIILALAALAALIALCRLYTFNQPLDWDLAAYTLVARELLEGARLYEDVWDIKPPGVFIVHAIFQSIFGDTLLMVFLLGTILAIATMVAIYLAASNEHPWAGVVAAGSFAIVCSDLHLEANRPNTEAYINLLLAGGIALLLRARSLRGIVVAVGFLALASVFKQPALIPAAAVLLVRAKLREIIWFVAMVCILWGGIFVYFALTGRGILAWQTFVLAPAAYSGASEQMLQSATGIFKAPAMLSILPGAILTLLAIVTDRAHRAMLVALLLAGVVAIVLPGKPFGHYYQLLLVPLCLGSGWAVDRMARHGFVRLAWINATILLVGLMVLQVPFYRLSVEDWTARQYGSGYIILQDSIRPLQLLLRPDETIFVWSDDPWIYQRLGRRLPTGMIFKSHVVDSPVGQRLGERVLRQLQDHPPDLLFLRDGWQGPDNSPIWRWFMEHYRPLPYDAKSYPMAVRYARRGSDLDRRTAP